MTWKRSAHIAVLMLWTCAAVVPTATARKRKRISRPDIASLLSQRRPQELLARLDDEKRAAVSKRWHRLLGEHRRLARDRGGLQLYPHPVWQEHVRLVGRSLVPEEARSAGSLDFVLVVEPLPEVYPLATGTILVTTGMLASVDSEAQLADVLARAITHVLLNHHLLEMVFKVRQDSKDWAAILEPLGPAGIARGRLVAREVVHDEADLVAIELALNQGYDVRSTVTLMQQLRQLGAQVLHGDVLSTMLESRHLGVREDYLRACLGGPLVGEIESRTRAGRFRGTDRRFAVLLGHGKRDNGLVALEHGQHGIAREHLDDAAVLTPDDPLTNYGLGRLYRALARTDDERAAAGRYFRKALEHGSDGRRLARAHLDHAIELIQRDQPALREEIGRELRAYVTQYQRYENGQTPPEIRFIYDYLELAGDDRWVAHPVLHVHELSPHDGGGASSSRWPGAP